MSKDLARLDVFAQYLLKLDVVEFIGVAKMLGVEVVKDLNDFEDSGKEFSELFEEMVDNFNALNRRKQRNLLKIMKKAGRR